MERTELTRDVEAIQIPGGHTLTLEKGWDVVITQSLGGTYTVQVPAYGGLFRIAGKDADALGKEATTAPAATAGGGLEEQVWATLKTCFDPEIPVNIVDLGLVYDLRITPEGDGQRVDVKMTLTAPGCGTRPSRPPDRSEPTLQFQAEDFAAARDGAAVLLVVGDEGRPAAARAAEDVVGDDAVVVDHVVRPPEPDVALEVVLVPVHDVDLLRDEAEERTPPRIEGCDLPRHVTRRGGERDRGDQREDQVRRAVGESGGRLYQQSDRHCRESVARCGMPPHVHRKQPACRAPSPRRNPRSRREAINDVDYDRE